MHCDHSHRAQNAMGMHVAFTPTSASGSCLFGRGLAAPSLRGWCALRRVCGRAARSGGRARRACWSLVTGRRHGSGCSMCCGPMMGHSHLSGCLLGAVAFVRRRTRAILRTRRRCPRSGGAGTGHGTSRAVWSVLCAVCCAVLSHCGCCAVQGRAVRVAVVGPCIVQGLVTRARVRRRGVACLSRAGRVPGGAAAGRRTSIVFLVNVFYTCE